MCKEWTPNAQSNHKRQLYFQCILFYGIFSNYTFLSGSGKCKEGVVIKQYFGYIVYNIWCNSYARMLCEITFIVSWNPVSYCCKIADIHSNKKFFKYFITMDTVILQLTTKEKCSDLEWIPVNGFYSIKLLGFILSTLKWYFIITELYKSLKRRNISSHFKKFL